MLTSKTIVLKVDVTLYYVSAMSICKHLVIKLVVFLTLLYNYHIVEVSV